MGTKNKPGDFDCYATAEPDEPMFILLGRDPCACLVVAFWVKLRQTLNPDDPKIDNARVCVRELEAYAREHGKTTELAAALDAMQKFVVISPEPGSEA